MTDPDAAAAEPTAAEPTRGSRRPWRARPAALNSIDTLPLERHPEAFATFDELLREALESPPHVSSG